ncbi:MAG: pyridoxine 5'-phosphate synthase [Bacteroidota bacterium]|nr:pyridoxine 5'-phosphate synthase [Bacteroidota bacterium]
MTKLSVNINKIATLRNSRGANNPNVVQVAIDCQKFGAQGITIHPRPDERHIRTYDVYALQQVITTEYNIEGYPDRRYIDLIKDVRPTQATLVPDPPWAITSNAGWDTKNNMIFLKEIISEIKYYGARVSLFLYPDSEMVQYAALAGADRVELYTEPYATGYQIDREIAVTPYINAALTAKELGIGVNAGHDLDLNNLNYLVKNIPFIDEVSIGHALICDALYYGLENTIQMYLRKLEK